MYSYAHPSIMWEGGKASTKEENQQMAPESSLSRSTASRPELLASRRSETRLLHLSKCYAATVSKECDGVAFYSVYFQFLQHAVRFACAA